MKNEEVKIIFVDLDQTILYHHDGKSDFDLTSIKALKKAQSLGIKVVIATARPLHSLMNTGFDKYLNPDAIICTNGNVIFENDIKIYEKNFDKKLVKSLINYCTSKNIVIQYATADERYLSAPINDYVKKYFTKYSDTIPPYKKYEDEDIVAMILFAPCEYDEELNNKFPSPIELCRFTDNGIDVHPFFTDKTNGIDVLLKRYNLTYNNAISFGDSRGDINMIKSCKYGTAMGNAVDDVKEIAGYITKHIKHHGVKKALKHFHII